MIWYGDAYHVSFGETLLRVLLNWLSFRHFHVRHFQVRHFLILNALLTSLLLLIVHALRVIPFVPFVHFVFLPYCVPFVTYVHVRKVLMGDGELFQQK